MFTCSCLSGSPALAVLVRALALEADDHRVARFDGAALDRFVARVAFAEALERLVDGLVFDGAPSARSPRSSPRSPGSKAGTTSNEALKVSGLPSSSTRSLMSGVAIGSTPFSTSASPTAFETRCSATSCMICGLKRWRMTLAGTLPGRKPGMRAERPSFAAAWPMASSTTLLGTSIVRSRRVSFTSTISDFMFVDLTDPPGPGICERGDSNPTAFRLPAPKAGASASSATFARGLTDQA